MPPRARARARASTPASNAVHKSAAPCSAAQAMSCWACQAATLPNAMPLEPSLQPIGEAVYKAIPPPRISAGTSKIQRPDSAKPSLSTSLQIATKPAKPPRVGSSVQHGYKGGRGGVDRAPDVHTRRWNQRPRPRSPDLGHAHSAAIRRYVVPPCRRSLRDTVLT